MKALFLVFIAICLVSCDYPEDTKEIKTISGGVFLTPYEYEGHDYLIFSGPDYFSAVVHSASCHYCDSINNLKTK